MSFSSNHPPINLTATETEAVECIKKIDKIFSHAIDIEFLSSIQLLAYAQGKTGSVQKQKFFDDQAKGELPALTKKLEELHLRLMMATSTDMKLKYKIEKSLGYGYIMLRDIQQATPFLQSAANYLIVNRKTSHSTKTLESKRNLCALVGRIYEMATPPNPNAAKYFYENAFNSIQRQEMFEANDLMLGRIRTTLQLDVLTPENYKQLKTLCKKIIGNCDTDLASEKAIDHDLKEQLKSLPASEQKTPFSSEEISQKSKIATTSFHVKDETMSLIEKQRSTAIRQLATIRARKPVKVETVKHVAENLHGRTFITSTSSSSSSSSQSSATPSGSSHKPSQRKK